MFFFGPSLLVGRLFPGAVPERNPGVGLDMDIAYSSTMPVAIMLWLLLFVLVGEVAVVCWTWIRGSLQRRLAWAGRELLEM